MIDSGSKVNAMTPAYVAKLGLRVKKTNIGTQKIDGSTLNTFEIVLDDFQRENKLDKARFFQETFLVANTTLEVIFMMFFYILSNAVIQFVEKKLTWKSYTTAEVLLTTKRIQLIDKKEFAKVVLDKNSKIFVMYIIFLDLALRVHLNREAQITSLLAKKVKIPDKYSDFTEVFSKKTLTLPECTKLNEYAINLENGKEPPYEPISSISLVKLETLKTYIKTHLKTGFIQPSKFLVNAPTYMIKRLTIALVCVWIIEASITSQ